MNLNSDGLLRSESTSIAFAEGKSFKTTVDDFLPAMHGAHGATATPGQVEHMCVAPSTRSQLNSCSNYAVSILCAICSYYASGLQLSSAFAKFAKAAPAPPPEAVKFAQSNSIVNTAISIVAFVVGAYAFVVLLNGLRSLLRRTWIKTVENQGPGSLLANLLSTLLNVIGVDLSSVASGAADSSNSPAAAVTPAAAARFLKVRVSAVSEEIYSTDLKRGWNSHLTTHSLTMT